MLPGDGGINSISFSSPASLCTLRMGALKSPPGLLCQKVPPSHLTTGFLEVPRWVAPPPRPGRGICGRRRPVLQPPHQPTSGGVQGHRPAHVRANAAQGSTVPPPPSNEDRCWDCSLVVSAIGVFFAVLFGWNTVSLGHRTRTQAFSYSVTYLAEATQVLGGLWSSILFEPPSMRLPGTPREGQN